MAMKNEPYPGRTYFKCSGGVNWGTFLPWLVVPFGVATLLAALMFWLFRVGHYYIVLVPLIAALAVAGCVKLAVGKGHCRNAAVAGVAGIVAGVLLYFGYYYCGMVHHLGPETAGRPDLLPYYIRARIHTDVLRDTHDSSRDDETPRIRKGNVYVNWAVFGLELAFVFGLSTVAGVKRARKPYCESCRRWMVREVTQFDPAQLNELTQAFRNGSARSLAAQCAKPVFATVPSVILAAEICPAVKDGMTRDCAVYVSLKNVTKAAGGNQFMDAFDSAQGKVLIHSLQLNPDEIAALGRRFKVLESLAGRAAVTALMPEMSAEEKSADVGPVADIKPVESDFAGRVLTKRNAIIANVYAFGALLFLFGGIGLAAWGGITAFPDKKSNQEVSPQKKALGITVLAVGGLFFVGTAGFFLVNPSYLGNRYLLKVLRREFARRPKCLVEPNDPDALIVEIVPKLNWGKLAWETARDVGFLRVYKARREILFEGDKERWRIPAAAITYCELEFFVEGQGTHGATKIFYTVLRAGHPGGFWEAPIRERGSTGIFQSGRRKKAALRLCAAIKEIQGAAR